MRSKVGDGRGPEAVLERTAFRAGRRCPTAHAACAPGALAIPVTNAPFLCGQAPAVSLMLARHDSGGHSRLRLAAGDGSGRTDQISIKDWPNHGPTWHRSR